MLCSDSDWNTFALEGGYIRSEYVYIVSGWNEFRTVYVLTDKPITKGFGVFFGFSRFTLCPISEYGIALD